ncbi:glycoside hydrolase family 2 TIM barrel-domain containing protein [Myxococcus sp. Y35]|uniref:glycoside hydrolase family 2 TIM barrel-domain containing protein n=1 Tax=Pseudomyxococcus flavus TaxID=3115648 RepID=UPI003CF617BF
MTPARSTLLGCALLGALLLPPATAAARTVLLQKDGQWQLQVDGRAYVARGVTFSGSSNSRAYEQDCARLAALGVNTLRTWGTGSETHLLLDAAHKHGLKVLVGLWMRHGQPGAEGDDTFDYTRDTGGMKKQLEDTLTQVRRFKGHPAVLAWGVGNEVILNSPHDAAKEAYARFLEKVVREIKQVDADHPVISVDAWTLAVPWWEKHVPSLDAYGLNVYGGGIHMLPSELAKAGVRKPWFVTEFGAQGEWDAPKDAHGVPREPTDEEKYAAIVDGWNNALAPHVKAGRCLGLFVFNYGASFDHTGLWLGMLSGTATRPAWHAVREAYTGQKPATPLPRIAAVSVHGAEREGPSTWARVRVDVEDSAPKLQGLSFAYNFRGAATRHERDEVRRLDARPGPAPGTWRVRMPAVRGAIKLYALGKDAAGNLAVATTSATLPLAMAEAARPGDGAP